MLLRFKPFWVNIVSLLKLLETNAFLEAFHVPSFSGQGFSQEFLIETLKYLGVREHHWQYTMKQFITQWFTYCRPGKIT